MIGPDAEATTPNGEYGVGSRVVLMKPGTGFLMRAYLVIRESLLHPRTTSYLVYDQPPIEPDASARTEG